ncbi:MAG: 23S rRNA (adenine(2030)-N(6))-methyltransferase RlmJ, partial [Betaproteobacteria bacterium]
ATGIYALWYPLMEPMTMRAFERGLVETGISNILQMELTVLPEGFNEGMRGCGMIVVNPPFGFEEQARAMISWMRPLLAREDQGTERVVFGLRLSSGRRRSFIAPSPLGGRGLGEGRSRSILDSRLRGNDNYPRLSFPSRRSAPLGEAAAILTTTRDRMLHFGRHHAESAPAQCEISFRSLRLGR